MKIDVIKVAAEATLEYNNLLLNFMIDLRVFSLYLFGKTLFLVEKTPCLFKQY